MALTQDKVLQEITDWIEDREVLTRLRCSAPAEEPCPRPIGAFVVILATKDTLGIGGFCANHLSLVAASLEVAEGNFSSRKANT